MIRNIEILRELSKQGAVIGGSFAQSLLQGHRSAPDVDVFQSPMTPTTASDVTRVNEWLTKATIDGQKFDFVSGNFPHFKKRFSPVNVAGINILDIRDQALNKLEVISKRGRKTDYFDIYFMLKNIRFESMIKMYSHAYPDRSISQLLKCLVYFDDVEKDESPANVLNVDWETVKSTLIQKVNAFATFYKIQL